MLIKEVAGKRTEDIIRESDEFMLKSVLDSMMLNIKNRLDHGRGVFTLDQVMAELNRQSDSVYIDPNDEDRRNSIMQAFEEQGMSVERGSGQISLAVADTDDATDAGEQEKENKTRELDKKAMDKLRHKSEKNRDGGIEL